MDEDGKFRGQLKATGLRPRFVDHLAEQGISIPAEVFAPDGGRRK
jgi:pilus assembly protein CpaF